MTREQAINYLFSCGFTNEQVGEVVRALTYEPTPKNDLGVEEVTALAEWTEKLTKASEDAYNKGYADGMKAQKPKTGHWIKHNTPNNTYYYDCSLCGCIAPCTETADSYLWKLSNFCPDCGAEMENREKSGG